MRGRIHMRIMRRQGEALSPVRPPAPEPPQLDPRGGGGMHIPMGGEAAASPRPHTPAAAAAHRDMHSPTAAAAAGSGSGGVLLSPTDGGVAAVRAALAGLRDDFAAARHGPSDADMHSPIALGAATRRGPSDADMHSPIATRRGPVGGGAGHRTSALATPPPPQQQQVKLGAGPLPPLPAFEQQTQQQVSGHSVMHSHVRP